MKVNKKIKYRNLKIDDLSEFKRLEVNKTDLIGKFTSSKELFANGQLFDVLIAKFLIISSKKENGKIHLSIAEDMFDDKQWKEFNRLTYSLGKMIRLAEENFDNLYNFLKKYTDKHPLSDILKRNSDCKKNKKYSDEQFERLEFNKLKNILSCILKTDNEFYLVKGLENKEGRKNFSKIYDSYISNRNYFAHGKLYFLYPNYEPILEIKENGQDRYIRYTKEIFIDNLRSYLYLNEILSDINQVIQNKIH